MNAWTRRGRVNALGTTNMENQGKGARVPIMPWGPFSDCAVSSVIWCLPLCYSIKTWERPLKYTRPNDRLFNWAETIFGKIVTLLHAILLNVYSTEWRVRCRGMSRNMNWTNAKHHQRLLKVIGLHLWLRHVWNETQLVMTGAACSNGTSLV